MIVPYDPYGFFGAESDLAPAQNNGGAWGGCTDRLGRNAGRHASLRSFDCLVVADEGRGGGYAVGRGTAISAGCHRPTIGRQLLEPASLPTLAIRSRKVLHLA